MNRGAGDMSNSKRVERTAKVGAIHESPLLPLLLEVGCEEIPARFLAQAEKDLGERVKAILEESRLLNVGAVHEPPLQTTGQPPLQTYSTPRRLVVRVPAVLAKQPDKVEEIIGPPVKVAFDAEGKPTRAAESFAQKNGVAVQDLTRVITPKGEYLAARKTTPGRTARDLLAETLPLAITGLSFPKSMYWVAKAGPRWVRPIRWVLAVLGEGKQAKVIPFEIAEVKSSRYTYGHRAYAKAPRAVSSFAEYAKKLRQAHVEFDPQSRLQTIRNESGVLLEPHLRLVEDRSLEDWHVNSAEWPSALRGGFDERFLHLPREILITVMRDHQKYFAVEDRKGKLEPRFIAILNRDDDPLGLVRQGHERVLTARFRDAEFFWNTDLKTNLLERSLLLHRITYQADLGSYEQKITRMHAIASHICDVLEGKGLLGQEGRKHVREAVGFCKCDLTTQMVQEFPELQGVVGGLYAAAQGEPQEVADAIYDHYLPQGVEDRCPRSTVGAIVSLADKLDGVVGGFAVGHEPTGSSDPFALRRQGNGIIKVLLEISLPISIRGAVQEAINALDVEWRRPREELFTTLLEFFAERLRYYLETVKGLRYDTVRAVLAAGWDIPIGALARAEGLEAIRGGEDFQALSQAAKRIKNILRKSATSADWEPGEVDAAGLQAEEERQLFEAYQRVAGEANELGAKAQYESALERISTLRPTVDRFFDKVLVMAEDAALRRNRLRLLGKLDALFSGIADFAEVAEKTEVGGRKSEVGTKT
ncbi:MAG: glycine--tRNA ligase subunit beta [Acidobacteriia bacterium]|nr:glycine--tRNA ligase subunit beta [Terriglobia bacterium]